MYRARQHFNDAGCLTYIDPSHTLPDHSLLTWNFTCMADPNESDEAETVEDDPPVSFTKWSRSVPGDSYWVRKLGIRLMNASLKLRQMKKLNKN